MYTQNWSLSHLNDDEILANTPIPMNYYKSGGCFVFPSLAALFTLHAFITRARADILDFDSNTPGSDEVVLAAVAVFTAGLADDVAAACRWFCRRFWSLGGMWPVTSPRH